MPFKDANFYHHRRAHPRLFEKGSFRTVPLSHTDYEGKFLVPGALARVARLRSSGKWKIQVILVPKR